VCVVCVCGCVGVCVWVCVWVCVCVGVCRCVCVCTAQSEEVILIIILTISTNYIFVHLLDNKVF